MEDYRNPPLIRENVLMPKTTLTLESDVAAELERRRTERGTTLNAEVNDLLRAGLRLARYPAAQAARFETKALPLGRPLLERFDDIVSVLAREDTKPTAAGSLHPESA
jgi:hypothetical protein